jgi:hypothetical protein
MWVTEKKRTNNLRTESIDKTGELELAEEEPDIVVEAL